MRDLSALNADGSVLVHALTDNWAVEGSVGNQSIVLLSSNATTPARAAVFGCAADTVEIWTLRNVSS
jgi:hypothetical protein